MMRAGRRLRRDVGDSRSRDPQHLRRTRRSASDPKRLLVKELAGQDAVETPGAVVSRGRYGGRRPSSRRRSAGVVDGPADRRQHPSAVDPGPPPGLVGGPHCGDLGRGLSAPRARTVPVEGAPRCRSAFAAVGAPAGVDAVAVAEPVGVDPFVQPVVVGRVLLPMSWGLLPARHRALSRCRPVPGTEDRSFRGRHLVREQERAELVVLVGPHPRRRAGHRESAR